MRRVDGGVIVESNAEQGTTPLRRGRCIRLNADRAQFLNAMRGLGFHLMSCGGNVRNKASHGQTGHHRRGAPFKLARRLDKGCDSMSPIVPPISGDDDIGVRLFRNAVQALFDGVGNVRNNLHGTTQEITAAFASNQALVNGTLGEVGLTREAFIDKTLVMAQVKVALMSVVGNEYLAMLEGAHSARIHVQVRGSIFCMVTLYPRALSR